MRRARILLADDHTMFTESLRTLLQADFEVLATAANGQDALRAAEELHPDVLVLDISMPELNGIEIARRLRMRSTATQGSSSQTKPPDSSRGSSRGMPASGSGVNAQPVTTPTTPKIVILTMHRDPTFAAEAFRAGALAYVLKTAPVSEIVAAIYEVLRGHAWISSGIAPAELLNDLKQERSASELTTREREVLQYLADGKSAKEVAALLDISPRTVEFHKYRIMKTTGVKTIAELTRYAMNRGIVPEK